MKAWPDEIAIRPFEGSLRADIELPGSKSLTNRAFALATLADGESRLEAVLESDDTRVLHAALEGLGFRIHWDRPARVVWVEGEGGKIPARRAEVYAGNAGTAMRFLVSLVALGCGEYRIDGSRRMHERPIGHLLDALRELGVDAWSEGANGCPPVLVRANGIPGGSATIPGQISSQFVSSILLAAPFARETVELEVTGDVVGLPFIDMTIGLMADFGVRTERNGNRMRVPAGQRYQGRRLAIEPDATAASYFLAAAALVGGEVRVRNLGRRSVQGDIAFAGVLEAMGATVDVGDDAITVRGDGRLRGVDLDFRAISDTFLTAAVLAPFADSPTKIRGIGHTRRQETDRVHAMATELRKAGAVVAEGEESLEIAPGPLHGATIETWDDHRIAMSFALLGLRQPGILIREPGCVAKTFPDFFECFETLRGTSR